MLSIVSIIFDIIFIIQHFILYRENTLKQALIETENSRKKPNYNDAVSNSNNISKTEDVIGNELSLSTTEIMRKAR